MGSVEQHEPVLVVGQGLCGTALAWELEAAGIDWYLVDRGEVEGSSRVAAGLVTPITGKGLNPSPMQELYLPEAIAFYQRMERLLGDVFWHPLPILRLFASEKEVQKWQGKSALASHVRWVDSGKIEIPDGIICPYGAFQMRGGGWLDIRRFLDKSRSEFDARGRLIVGDSKELLKRQSFSLVLHCAGAAGLISSGRAHRCAKGEILTVTIPDLALDRIVNCQGWLVPLGGDSYRAGATYEWEQLDSEPTERGRIEVMEKIRRITRLPFEVVEHVAGVRPIMRHSIPVVERVSGGWWINGLGSKGTQNAPSLARRVVENCVLSDRGFGQDPLP